MVVTALPYLVFVQVYNNSILVHLRHRLSVPDGDEQLCEMCGEHVMGTLVDLWKGFHLLQLAFYWTSA